MTKSTFAPGPGAALADHDMDRRQQRRDGQLRPGRANGAAIRESYVAIYGGKEHPNPGPWNFDEVIHRQNSENEREDIFMRGGKIVGAAKLSVSPDGKALAAIWKFGELQDVRVFDRE